MAEQGLITKKDAGRIGRGIIAIEQLTAEKPTGQSVSIKYIFAFAKITENHEDGTYDGLEVLVDDKYIISDTVTMGPAYVGNIGRRDYSQARSEKYYFDKIKSFFPNLSLGDISLHQAGINAKIKGHVDFVIERDSRYPNCINLLGIDSPGLTSSLAIAKYVRELLQA